MPAAVFTTVSAFEMIGFGKNNKTFVKVVIHDIVLLFIVLIVARHLNTTCVGPIPVVKELTGVPELL